LVALVPAMLGLAAIVLIIIVLIRIRNRTVKHHYDIVQPGNDVYLFDNLEKKVLE
jgi:hypothetical protein